MEKIFDNYNFLCINKKEETYYRAFDSRKSTIDLAIASLMIATEIEWSKEYELRFIILKQESLYETTTEIEHRKSKLDAVSVKEPSQNHTTSSREDHPQNILREKEKTNSSMVEQRM